MAQFYQEPVLDDGTEDAFLAGVEPLGLAELLDRYRTSKRRGAFPGGRNRSVLHRSRSRAGVSSPLAERNVQTVSPDHRAHNLNLLQRVIHSELCKLHRTETKKTL